ncbi:hypothetical protein PR048_015654 [Dryococelus australis]|uniref:Helitron helicase-like domain-containing protein n=1 Tax=Dryococelus australis TaxID=614101 RepID=A0ABQ9HHJ7_9NEOP|nr:hypothetical protein PR048_015654 [Dryococelus australis]
MSSGNDWEPSQSVTSHQKGAVTSKHLKRVPTSAHFHVSQEAVPSQAPDPPVCITRGTDSCRCSSCLHMTTEAQQSHAPEPAVIFPAVSYDAGILSGSILMDETIVQQLLGPFYEEESAPVLILQRQDQPARSRARQRGSEFAVDAHDLVRMVSEYRHWDEDINRNGTFTICSMRGKVHLPPLGDCPQLLHHLLTGDGDDYTDYIQFIINYNAALSFASFCADGIVESPRCSVYTFQIHGQVHRLTAGAARPPEGEDPWYNQLYFIDVDAVNATCDLKHVLSTINPLAQMHKSMHEMLTVKGEHTCLKGRPLRQITLTLIPGLGKYPNIYNLPAAMNEVAAIFVDDVPPMINFIRTYSKDRPAQFITDPITYPLLFPHGEHWYTSGVSHSVIVSESRNTVTCNQYYAFHIMQRCNSKSLKIWFIRQNEDKLRVDEFLDLHEHAEGCCCCSIQGWEIIHPTFLFLWARKALVPMLPRFSSDQMLLWQTRSIHHSHLQSQVAGDCDAYHRPDVVCRIFKVKFDSLIDNIQKKQIFGKVSAYFYTIEFQKRELPNAYILIILDKGDSSCRFYFPRAFRGDTHLHYRGFGQYMRPDNSFETIGTNVYDNRHVVPCSQYICSSLQETRYLYKYIHKGHNSAILHIGCIVRGEATSYLGCRYVSSPEACWKHHCRPVGPAPGKQTILIIQDNNVAGALERAHENHTHLTAFFYYNSQHKLLHHCGTNLTYVEFPWHFCWREKQCMWNARENGGFNTISRIHSVNTQANQELICLLLFSHILFHCNIADPLAMNNNLKPYLQDDMSDDLEAYENRALTHIQFRLGIFSKTLPDYVLPCPDVGRVHNLPQYEVECECNEADPIRSLLNADQNVVFT